MTHSWSYALIVSCFLIGSSGCDFQGPYFGYDEWTYNDGWDPMWMGEPIEVSQGVISGSYGMSQLSEPTPGTAQGWRASAGWGMDMSTVTVEATEPSGRISMALIDMYGVLEGDVLALGQSRTYAIDDDGLDPFVMVTGCTGFDPSSWEYDDVAETVTVSVEPHTGRNGARRVHFEATFVSDAWAESGAAPYLSTLAGSFEWVPMYPQP